MDYAGRGVVVAGARMAGAACAEVLLGRGAKVTVIDKTNSAQAEALAAAGAHVVIGDELPEADWAGVSELIVSPGFPPYHQLVGAATARGLEVFSEPELAWRLRGPQAPPWLAITGTNGKTTTTTMLAAILRAAGLRADALGNIGVPLVTTVLDGSRYDVVAVELSSQQLHWSSTLAPAIGALLNLADDHLDWHGGFDAYAGAKLAVWRGGVAVGNLDDPRVAAALAQQPGRTIGFTLEPPKPGQFGVEDGQLVDWTGEAPVPLVEAAQIRPPGAHNVANALAAAALARSYGVAATAVREGLLGYRPEPHRNAYVATVGGVDYVNDSKATNPHAALAALLAYPRVIWVAGGQLKGVDVNDLVQTVADRLAGAVLLGVDRADLARALARHAPHVPVVDVASTDDGAMGEVVRAAAALAAPGDTVLLAPAAASKDMFVSFERRGDAFAAAVRALAAGTDGGPAQEDS